MFDRVRQGIQNVERTDDIKRGARERNRPDGCAGKARASGLSPESQAACREVETECATVMSEQIEVVAGSTAAIEQAQVASSCRSSIEQRAGEVLETSKPEMTLFGEGRCAQ